MNNKKAPSSITVHVYNIFFSLTLQIFRALVGCYSVHVVKQLMRIVKISNTQGNLKIADSNKR